MKQKFAHVVTYGCQQNENDSEKIKGMLTEIGYEITDKMENADVILFNTCAVRENAENRVLGNIGALKALKAEKPNVLIGVFGCMMQQEEVAKMIRRKHKHVSLIFGTEQMHKFPTLLNNALSKFVVDIKQENKVHEGIPTFRESKIKANIPIISGCNNFCSYCIVPYVRGRERSREAEFVLDEVKSAVENGIKEITLLGQNVNSYGKDNGEISFAELLFKVSEIDPIKRIRFLTSHPKDLSDELIDVMASRKNICKHIHLPIQSGSNKVLGDMNRKYTRESYLEIVEKLRNKMPEIAITTDIIVGFPSETKQGFDDTMSLLEKVRYDNIYSYLYSRRTGTPAATMEDASTQEETQKRFEYMVARQKVISNEINQNMLGKTYEVLIEGESKNNADVLMGRTEGNKVVHFTGDFATGDIAKIKITDAKSFVMKGKVIDD